MVDFKKHPAQNVGTRCRQCRPKAPGSGVFLRNPRTDPGNSHSLLEFSDVAFQENDFVLALITGSAFQEQCLGSQS